LNDLVTWYEFRQAGWQMSQWDIQNKEMTAIQMLIPLSFAVAPFAIQQKYSGFCTM